MEDLDLKELFEIFWSKRIHVILIVIICLIVGIIYSYALVVPKYKSETSLLIVQPSTSTDSASLTSSDLTLSQKLVYTYSELIKSDPVMRTVINNLNLNMSESDLKASITVSSVTNTELIRIRVINDNPNNAKIIANELIKAFGEQIKNIYNIDNINVIDEAKVENTPYNVNHIKDLAIFLLMGIVISALYVLITNMLDTTIKNKDSVEKNLGLIVLTEIPLCNFNETKPDKRGGKK